MPRHKGFKMSPEHRAKIATALRGKPKSAEARANMSAAKKGKPGHPMTERGREAISKANTGRKLTDEHRIKLSAAKIANPTNYWLGKKRGPQSAETRAKISAGNKGKKRTAEQVRAIRRPRYVVEYAGVQFRSTYEARAAAAFDALKMRWEYEPRSFDLGDFTYMPDFYLPDQEVYWELKGWFSPEAKRKVDCFRSENPDTPLIVATLPVLKELERSAKLSAH